MMKSLIITVAGMSSRFNRDSEEEVLKCLYHEGSPARSLLNIQVHRTFDLADEIIVVGGYKYQELCHFIHEEMKDVSPKMKWVFNDHYSDYGSCYSLLKGIETVSEDADEIVFIEGDLLFDREGVVKLFRSEKDAVSVNTDPILANKAVALYFDTRDYPHYLYDTGHSFLEIDEPFSAIFNSAQMWKFMNRGRLKEICASLSPGQERGTNLEIIQQYFGPYHRSRIDIITINHWFNCNTVADYREAIKASSL